MQVKDNKPYDEFVRDIITATGSNKDNPPASYYKVLREPTELMENTTTSFLQLDLIVTSAMIIHSKDGPRTSITSSPLTLHNSS